ncbi:ADP-ribosylglycohydrolase family protein [Corynebacterium vitaeruminis]|uniref:ADP-ribosylglycohydrolase family protein n=1 Tax=Corynebacterium vitaeruminis TaxID=38305 RepID=UPI0023F328A2|nr:ADP-ribosylglycohydrolase family protein [Corynebacterium vitaeruminis]
MPSVLDRARGALYGQLIGDNLGQLVEGLPADEIDRTQLRDMRDGGVHGLIAGQPTDDSEMALALARSLVARRGFDRADVLSAYRSWARSEPFSLGATCRKALLSDVYSPESQANGALMRVSPIGIAYAFDPELAGRFAELDARLTHIHPRCVERNGVYARALATQIRDGIGRDGLVRLLAGEPDPALPSDFSTHMGWVEIAFAATAWEVGNAESFESGLIDVIARGGDTDTNAAIAGAMLGALFGEAVIPARWRAAIDACRPSPGTLRPRPERYWPCDARSLAAELLNCAQ